MSTPQRELPCALHDVFALPVKQLSLVPLAALRADAKLGFIADTYLARERLCQSAWSAPMILIKCDQSPRRTVSALELYTVYQ